MELLEQQARQIVAVRVAVAVDQVLMAVLVDFLQAVVVAVVMVLPVWALLAVLVKFL